MKIYRKDEDKMKIGIKVYNHILISCMEHLKEKGFHPDTVELTREEYDSFFEFKEQENVPRLPKLNFIITGDSGE